MIIATYEDKPLVIDILCDSLDTNKSVNYVVKQDNKRKTRIRILMEYSFEVCYLFGQVYLSDDKSGCALILFPDKKKITLKSILLDVKLMLCCIGIMRVPKVLNRDSRIKRYYPKCPVFYLWFIGVDPKKQHKGVGSTLIKNIIIESNVLKRPVYLETSMQENLVFYSKVRFEIYKELDFGHKLFLMKREFIN